MTAQDVYKTARTLSLPERLRLAALILEDLPRPPLDLRDLPGYDNEWSDEDIRDFAAHSGRYAALISPEDEALLPSSEEIEALKAEQGRV